MAHEVVLRFFPGGGLDGLDRTGAQRELVVGNDQAVVHADHAAEAPAGVAGAHGGVEREHGRDGLGVAQVALGAMQAGGEAPQVCFAIVPQAIDIEPPPAALERDLDRLDRARALHVAHAEAVGHHVQQLARAGGRSHLALGLHLGEATGRQPLLQLFRGGARGQFHGKSEHDARIVLGGAAPLQLGMDGVRRIVAHGQRRLAVEELASAREQQLEVVVQLGHRAHGGARRAHGVGLVDGDCRGHALHLVHGGLVHAVQELARVGAEGLHIAALALGIQRVEHQAGLAGAAGTGDHGELARADVQVDVLEVVLARAVDTDQSLGHERVFLQ